MRERESARGFCRKRAVKNDAALTGAFACAGVSFNPLAHVRSACGLVFARIQEARVLCT